MSEQIFAPKAFDSATGQPLDEALRHKQTMAALRDIAETFKKSTANDMLLARVQAAEIDITALKTDMSSVRIDLRDLGTKTDTLATNTGALATNVATLVGEHREEVVRADERRKQAADTREREAADAARTRHRLGNVKDIVSIVIAIGGVLIGWFLSHVVHP
jgi:gas vesicle protein